jgi:hypothetical protein
MSGRILKGWDAELGDRSSDDYFILTNRVATANQAIAGWQKVPPSKGSKKMNETTFHATYEIVVFVNG